MRLKRYLLHINPLLSNPEAARRLLRLFAIVLSIGILSGVYNFLLFTFNNDISQRRGYMSSAIAEAHAFFTNREALLESLTLRSANHFVGVCLAFVLAGGNFLTNSRVMMFNSG